MKKAGGGTRSADRISAMQIKLTRRLGDVGCLGTFRSLDNLKFDGVSFLQRAIAIANNCGVMNKHIRSIFSSDEAVSFRVIEPLYRSLHFHVPPQGDSDDSDFDAEE
jgi:hypothetical protein